MGALLDDFKRFVTDEEATVGYANWARDNHGGKNYSVAAPSSSSELGKWYAFRNAIVAGGRPSVPAMTTRQARALIDAGVQYLDATAAAVPAKLIGFATGAGSETFTGLDPATRAKYLDAILGVRGNVARFDTTGDAHDLSLLSDCHSRGIEAVPIVMGVLDPSAYAARARAVALMAKPLGYHRYELGNEPNLPKPDEGLSLTKYGGIDGYVRCANAGYDAVKSVDPFAEISTGGIAAYGVYGEVGDPDTMDGQLFLERCVRAGQKFDAAAFHPYSFSDGATAAELLDRSKPWNGLGQTIDFPHSIRATLDANGMGAKPIWITEVGVPTKGTGWAGGVDEQEQADYLTAVIAYVRAQGRIEMLCVYSLRDLPSQAGNMQGRFGILNADWSSKRAASAFAAATAR